jgi:hypothetical protein
VTNRRRNRSSFSRSFLLTPDFTLLSSGAEFLGRCITMGIFPVQHRREPFRATATVVAESRNDAGWRCETQTLQRSKFAPSAPDGVDLRGQTPNRLTLGKPGVAGGLVSDDIPALPGRASVREHVSGPVDGMPRKGPTGDRYTWFACGGRDVKVTESAVRRAICKLAPPPDRKMGRPHRRTGIPAETNAGRTHCARPQQLLDPDRVPCVERTRIPRRLQRLARLGRAQVGPAERLAS